MMKCCGQETYYDSEIPRNNRRLQLIRQIKHILGDIEDNQRGSAKPSSKRYGRFVSNKGVEDLEEECRQYRKRRECSPPTITAIGLHDYRPTSDYSNMQYQHTKEVTYVNADKPDTRYPMPPAPWELPRKPSQELRAGTLYSVCECTKRNGLQQDCPRWDCSGRPECIAINPGPCCGPSGARKPVRGDRRGIGSGNVGTPNVLSGSSVGKPPNQSQMKQLEITKKEFHEPPAMTPSFDKKVVRFVQFAQTPQSSSEHVSGGMPSLGFNSMMCFCVPTVGHNTPFHHANTAKVTNIGDPERFIPIARIGVQGTVDEYN